MFGGALRVSRGQSVTDNRGTTQGERGTGKQGNKERVAVETATKSVNTKRFDKAGGGMCRQVALGPRKRGDMRKHGRPMGGVGAGGGRYLCECVCGRVRRWGAAEPKAGSVYSPPLTCSTQHSRWKQASKGVASMAAIHISSGMRVCAFTCVCVCACPQKIRAVD